MKTYPNCDMNDRVAMATSIRQPLAQFPMLTFLDWHAMNIVWQNVPWTHRILANLRCGQSMNYYYWYDPHRLYYIHIRYITLHQFDWIQTDYVCNQIQISQIEKLNMRKTNMRENSVVKWPLWKFRRMDAVLRDCVIDINNV